MKKLLLPLFALTLVLGTQSCSEDFQVSAPYKPVTIVYGMLDMQDTAHYVRIQKTFLDEKKNAFDLAKVSDSSFYKESDLDVVIKELAGGSQIGQPIPLTRVDMDKEGYPKDPGVFFTTTNWAYKFKAALNPAHTYRLVINNKANNTTDSSEIKIIDSSRLGLSSAARILKFPSTDPQVVFSLFFDQGVVGNVDYLEGAVRFRWIEKNVSTNTQVKDSADFLFASSSGDALKTLSLKTEARNVYNFLAEAMGTAPPGEERYMDSSSVILYGAGKELYDYMVTAQLQSSGLTTDQIKPVYTNIRGKDVFGLFTSRSFKQYDRFYIEQLTMEALKTNAITAPLNIKGYAPH